MDPEDDPFGPDIQYCDGPGGCGAELMEVEQEDGRWIYVCTVCGFVDDPDGDLDEPPIGNM